MYKKNKHKKKHKKETKATKLKGKLRKKTTNKTKKTKKSTLIKMENKQNYSDDNQELNEQQPLKEKKG